jgi:hypothetical protein
MKRQFFHCLAVAAFLSSGVLVACQVPVFRYALERWNAGTWKIVVLSEGPLSSEHRQSLQKLEQSSTATAANSNLPFGLQHIDLTAATPADRRRWEFIREVAGDPKTPVVVALYPQLATVDQPVASLMRLSANTADQILTSSARSELASRLSAGHTAVWLFLESGNSQSDQEAFERLNRQLKVDEQRLLLPTAADLQITPEQLNKVRIPLKIQFSTIRLSRDDPSEQFLVDSLLGSETDLKELAEPIAFPVFGRGRVLYALVGKGIDSKTVAEASDFLIGPCSCQVKEQNPGFDLLLIHNWAASIGDSLISSTGPQSQQKPKLLTIPRGNTNKSGSDEKPMR